LHSLVKLTHNDPPWKPSANARNVSQRSS
jgi:hypothetical protein